ncbi:MAG: recombinase family protein [Bacillota bacterium]
MEYGYIRVSTKEQNEDRQRKAMHDFGIGNTYIYMDKQSGKNFVRPQYKKMMKKFRAGDILVIKSIDRSGRNYNEIIEQWRIITKEKKVAIVVLDMPLLDTRTKDHGLTEVFISDLVLQILSYVAETERDNIRQRQAEGIAIAKENGKHLGRPKKTIPRNFGEVYALYQAKEITMEEGAKRLEVSRTTYGRWVRFFEEKSMGNQ